MTNLIQSLLVPLVTIIGLIVLMALHDLDANVAIPIIVGLAGVHIGAQIGGTGTTTTVTTPTTTSTTSKGPIL